MNIKWWQLEQVRVWCLMFKYTLDSRPLPMIFYQQILKDIVTRKEWDITIQTMRILLINIKLNGKGKLRTKDEDVCLLKLENRVWLPLKLLDQWPIWKHKAAVGAGIIGKNSNCDNTKTNNEQPQYSQDLSGDEVSKLKRWWPKKTSIQLRLQRVSCGGVWGSVSGNRCRVGSRENAILTGYGLRTHWSNYGGGEI